jgi:hypothetical protein
MWYRRGQEQLIAKHGKAVVQTQVIAPPNKRFLHLYILLRLAQRAGRWYAAAHRRVADLRGDGHWGVGR